MVGSISATNEFRFVANVSLLFRELPFLDRFATRASTSAADGEGEAPKGHHDSTAARHA
jgi:hydroxypyruvate isomerase